VPRAVAEESVKERRIKKQQKEPAQKPEAAPLMPAKPRRPKIDEGALLGKEGPIVKLPDFFAGVNVLLFGDMDAAEKHKLTRLVVAFGGNVVEAMSENTTHVATAMPWDSAFQDALDTHPQLAIVRPTWIESCAAQRKLLPVAEFSLHP